MKPVNRKIRNFLLLLLLFGVHLYGVFNLLPPWATLINDQPIFNNDYPVHYYQAYTARRYLRQSGRTWGYDPHFMAGYPDNTIYDVGYKLNELFVYAFSFLGLGRAFKLFVFLTFILPPFIIWAAARKFNLPDGDCLIAVLLSVILWHMDHHLNAAGGAPGGLIGWGMFTFALACFLSVLVVGLFYHYLSQGDGAPLRGATSRTPIHPPSVKPGWFSRVRDKKDMIWLFILGPLLVALHLFAAIIVALPIAIILAGTPGRKKSHALRFLIAWLLWILLVNSFWIIPFARFAHWSQPFPPGSLKFSLFLQNLFFFRGGIRPLPLLLLFALIGAGAWKGRERVLKILYGLTTVFFLGLGLVGGHLHPVISSLEPHRFVIALKCLLIIPAARGIAGAAAVFPSRTARWAAFLIVVAATIVVIPTNWWLTSELPHGAAELIALLKQSASPSGRILAQDSGSLDPGQYWGTHIIYFPLHFKIEQIGGPHYLIPLRQHFAEFSANILFGRHLFELKQEQFKSYCDLYNLKWAVVWSNKAIRFFRGMEGYVREIGRVGRGKGSLIHVYEILREPSFFLKGSGQVESDYNRLVITQASPGEIILAYHWLETLKTEPEVRMEPVTILDDPAPFIKIHNPGYPRIVIYN